ncbi:MAG: bifunctional riboflavin kinase/FAD synthetase [Acidobacteriota bacterium]
MHTRFMEVAFFPGDARPRSWQHPVLAIGNFDGLHRGHVKIVERVRRGAAERSGTPLVLTFSPHPPRVVRPDKAPPLLMTERQKLEALERAGIRGVAVVRFTPELARWEPERFVKSVLVDWLRVAEVWVGADFLFGRERSGTYSLLRTLGAQYGFRAEKIDPVRYKDFVVSSTRIRRLIAEGRVDEAGTLLGHHFYIDGTVIEGTRRGRELGFPTANLATENELVPPNGVYATLACFDGVVRPAVSNIGVRPTFGDGAGPAVETHVLDYAGDLYGRELRLAFVQRLRDERRFGDVDALRSQIEADVRRVRRLFDRLSV